MPYFSSQSTPQKVPMSQLQNRLGGMGTSKVLQAQPPLLTSISDNTIFTSSNSASPSRGNDPFSLADFFVPLETIQPGIAAVKTTQNIPYIHLFAGTLPPLSLHDKDGLAVLVHFGKESPREDVTVMVVSIMSKNISGPIKNVKFQAAVPKVCQCCFT